MVYTRLLLQTHLTVLLLLTKVILAKEAGEILSNIDIEGGKEYKYIYSSLLNKPPVEDVVELNSDSQDEANLQGIGGEKRQINNGVNNLWPQGIIPYTVEDSTYKNPGRVHQVLNEAMSIWSTETCVQFWDKAAYSDAYRQQHLGHKFFAKIQHEVNCMSGMGMNRGNASGQALNLNENGCVKVGTILHELGHLLGLVHEHQRSDRNESETINDKNIKTKYKHNFNQLDSTDNTKFDYNSIMHYGLNVFSHNNKPTISIKDSNLNFLAGQREHLSFYDIKAINLAYGCSGHCTTTTGCQNDGYMGKDCNCVCPTALSGSQCTQIDTEWQQTGCGSNIYTMPMNGVMKLTSPNHPFSYGNRKCAWLIKSSVGQPLSISLNMEDLPRNKHTHKCYHSLEIRYNLIGQPGVRFCGDTSFPFHFDSLGSSVMIIFHGDDTSYSGKNFEIRIASGSAKKACSSNPCTGFGQKCIDGVRKYEYTCECMDNFSGQDCSLIETLDCSFDKIVGPLPLCLFSQSTDDQLEWIRHEKSTSSRNTGPNGDVIGDGSYLYMESSYPARTGNKATLDSALIAKGHKCLSFFYHMYGNTMGKLSVFLRTDTGELWSDHWMKHGNQGNEWHHILLDIVSYTSFKIQITAERGRSHRSDIAIDSVSVMDGPCDYLEDTGVEMVTMKGDSNCPMYYMGKNCDIIYERMCDFDEENVNDFCFFSNDGRNSQSYMWKKHSGRTPTSFTGPNEDVSGGGNYIYVDGSFVQPGTEASIVSQYILAGRVCLDIQVHLYGQGVGALMVKIENTAGQDYTLKSDIVSANKWSKVFFDITSTENFRMIVTACRGETSTSDIALDDFNVARGKCLAAFSYTVTLS